MIATTTYGGASIRYNDDAYEDYRGADTDDDIEVDACPCPDCGRELNDEGLCDECENAAWERQHGPGRA